MNNRILTISDSREFIPAAYLMGKGGVGSDIYVNDRIYKKNFEGIMPRLSMGMLPSTLRKTENVIFDITLPNHKTPQDLALFSLFNVSSNSEGVFGPIADKLMKTHQVIGSSSWTQHIELDREAGFELAKKLGFDIPKYHKFKGLQAGIKFLESPEGRKQKWVFKMLGNGPLDLTYPETFDGELLDMMQTVIPVRFAKMRPPVNAHKVDYILQEFVEGVECSNELWWNGREFINANRTIESKKLGSGETGPATGSQSNTVVLCDDLNAPVFKEMQKLKPYLIRSGYLGPIDANCILTSEGKIWFLEWTPRFGYSALYCLLKFMPREQISNFFLHGFRGVFQEGYVASQLLSLYPYPNPDQNDLAQLVENGWVNHDLNDPDCWFQDIYLAEDDKLRCGGADGMICVITCMAKTYEDAIAKVLKKCEDFKVTGNKQYRIDHLAKHDSRIKKLNKMGVEF